MMYRHVTLAARRWAEMSLAEQMLNIGSEISRANRWKSKANEEQVRNAVFRALELISLTLDAQRGRHNPGEFTRLYEVICDYYLGANEYRSDGPSLQKYFDAFAYSRVKGNQGVLRCP